MDESLRKVRRLERLHLVRVFFWWGTQIPLVTVAFFFARSFWLQISVLYLVYVSLYANGATDLGAWQGARAERRSIENPPVEH
jgi:hypothetical protein